MARRVEPGAHDGSTASARSIGLGRRLASTPATWRAVAILLVGIAFAALAAGQTAQLRRAAADGRVVAGPVVIAADERWPGLEPGDRIVATGGSPLAGREIAFRLDVVPVRGDATIPGGHHAAANTRTAGTTRAWATIANPAARRSAPCWVGVTQRCRATTPPIPRDAKVARTKRPPGVTTRRISASARAGSRYQWYEIVLTRRSTESSGQPEHVDRGERGPA
jgi:hypothetical protein